MQVSIVVIGKELLLGQVIDTNSSDISHRLDPLGWQVGDIQTVDDDAYQITRAIDRAFESSDVVITTGGLGPTKDDITKQTLCNYFGGELVHDASVLETVKRVIARRGLDVYKRQYHHSSSYILCADCRYLGLSSGRPPRDQAQAPSRR